MAEFNIDTTGPKTAPSGVKLLGKKSDNTPAYVEAEDLLPKDGTTLPANSATVPQLKFTPGGSLLTTAEQGALEFVNDRFYLTNVDVQRAIDRTTIISLTPTIVNNSNTEDDLWTYALAADSLKAGTLIKVSDSGFINNTAAANVTVTGYLGAVELFSLAPSLGNLSVGTYHWNIDFNFLVRSEGAAGEIIMHSEININGAVSNTLTLITVNTTIENILSQKAQWGTAAVANSISSEFPYIEFKG